MNKTYNLKLETISPVHIGTGEEIPAYNYILKDNKVIFFSINNLLKILNDEQKRKAIRSLEQKKDILKLRQSINKYKDKLNINDIKEYSMKVDKKFKKKYKDEIDKSINDNQSNKMVINEFMNYKGNFYLPGSSLKGSIVTALGKKESKNILVRDSKKINNKMKIKGVSLRIGESEEKNNFYQAIKKNTSINLEIIRKNDFESGFDIKPQRINKYYSDRIKEYIKYLKQMLKYIEKKQEKDLNKKKRSYLRRTKKQSQDVKKFLKNMKKKIDKLDSKKSTKKIFYLNIGFGGSYVFKKNKDENNKLLSHPSDGDISDLLSENNIPIPRTYRIIDKQPFGWVKCTLNEK